MLKNSVSIPIPTSINTAINILNAHGYEAYIVGGAVRDYFINRSISDYDLCTSAEPEKILECFSDYNTVTTGIKHGTVIVIIENQSIEITTFRNDGEYSDGRHPDAVSLTSDIISDLRRRDFTINAIAYNPSSGVIDPFNGLSDIENSIIRTIGDPCDRFNEDALRILRALRFSSVLGFTIDESTSTAITRLSHNLRSVSYERIRDELLKLLSGFNSSNVILNYRNVISILIPELEYTFDYNQNSPHHELDLFRHLIKTAHSLRYDPLLSFAGLLHDVGKPLTQSTDKDGHSHYYSHASVSSEITRTIMKRLRFSNKEMEYVCSLIKYHDGVIDESDKAIRRRINQLGPNTTHDLLDLQLADSIAQKEVLDPERKRHNDILRDILSNVISNNECTNRDKLRINGNDLKSLGYVGKDIGTMLKEMLNLVIDGQLVNDKEVLVKYAKEQIKKED